MLYLRPHRRLAPVLRPLHCVNTILVAVAPMGAVLGLRRALPDHFALSAISLIAPHARFLAFFRLNKEFWDCRVSAGLLIGYGWPQHLFGFMSDSFIVKSSFLVGMVLCMPRASSFRSMVLTIASRSAGFLK